MRCPHLDSLLLEVMAVSPVSMTANTNRRHNKPLLARCRPLQRNYAFKQLNYSVTTVFLVFPTSKRSQRTEMI